MTQVQATRSTSLEALRGATLPAPRVSETALSVGFNDGPSYALLRDISKDFATSDIVPQTYRGKPANCMIAVNMAARIGADPLMVMQNLYIVHGTPGWSSKFLIACFNQCGRYTSVRYEFSGKPGEDNWGCRAYATEKSTGEKVEGPLITVGLAKEEKWYDKSGSKWKTMPEQMLRYRSAAWMINTVAPEIAMGLSTVEEVQDTFDLDKSDDGTYRITSADIAATAGHDSQSSPDNTVPPADSPKAQANTPQKQEAETPPAQDAPSKIYCPLDGYEVNTEQCGTCPERRDCKSWKKQ